jgi:hypothetical protein
MIQNSDISAETSIDIMYEAIRVWKKKTQLMGSEIAKLVVSSCSTVSKVTI